MSGEAEKENPLEELKGSVISVAEAVAITKMTPSYIRRLIRTKKIAGVKFGRDWFTTEEAIREYLRKERRPGPKGQEE